MGRRFDREDDGRASRHPSQFGRFAAERYFLRRPRLADNLGAAFLPRLLATCAERAPAARDHSRRIGVDGRPLLGSRRARYAGSYAKSRSEAELSVMGHRAVAIRLAELSRSEGG